MALALIPLGLGARLSLERQGFISESRSAHATVVDVVQKDGRNPDRGPVMYPMLQWSDPDGLVHVSQSNVGGFPAPLAVGDDVAVLYVQSRPDDVRIDSVVSLWLEPAIYLVTSLVTLMLGLWLWRRTPRKKRT